MTENKKINNRVKKEFESYKILMTQNIKKEIGSKKERKNNKI